MVEFRDSVHRVAPPLHVQSISNEPLDVRLAAIRQAIAAEENPNQLGGWKNPGVARPLHYAIDDSAQHDYKQLKQNLPVIELLIKAGADPRLPDLQPGRRSPIQKLDSWFKAYNESHSSWATEDLELYPFYKAALRIMKKTAAELDAQDKIQNQQALEEKEPARSTSWFVMMKFW
ncbi:hypothetical protein P153DRAFT_388361 [Dothidotthia symphoricarpi CBS 119687]|uniref:Ankyrin n=1 Tax=Dothidotthia symphoricarpi CBS 119687 TaxID=1392245 RepID=A0A6A6A3D5_9PLEO|nr:uncharacterized protein P153DRAFT_388361 [Dothidotthia symphoricarpi CBS 119687]KAF2126320.1 hypothetical protein P153DRAFT_388361 [Dothidotthia symphoricarpi CBS 119687]